MLRTVEDRPSIGALGLVTALLVLSIIGTATAELPPVQNQTQLAGNALTEYPFFDYVRAFNENATVEVALDPTRFPGIVGQTGDIYVVNARSKAQWESNPSLVASDLEWVLVIPGS